MGDAATGYPTISVGKWASADLRAVGEYAAGRGRRRGACPQQHDDLIGTSAYAAAIDVDGHWTGGSVPQWTDEVIPGADLQHDLARFI